MMQTKKAMSRIRRNDDPIQKIGEEAECVGCGGKHADADDPKDEPDLEIARKPRVMRTKTMTK